MRKPLGTYFGKAPSGEHIVVLAEPNMANELVLCLRPIDPSEPMEIIKWLSKEEA